MIHFVAPQGWPSGPAGWLPPADWSPGHGLPKPPRGWVFYVDDYGMPADPGPYHWDPDVWIAAQNAYGAVRKTTGDGTPVDLPSEVFPAYTPRQHRSVSEATASNQVETDRLIRRPRPVRTFLVVAVVAMIAVFSIRPELLEQLKDAVTSPDPSTSEPRPDTFTPLPAPDDLIAAAMTSLGHRCITEALEPHLIGCTRQEGDTRVTVRWVLDADGDVITFQVLGNATGHGGAATTSVAAVLQLATGDPHVGIITALPELDKREQRDFEFDWGSVHIADLGADGLQLIQAVRADGPPPSMTVKPFTMSPSEARTALPTDGDFDCSGKDIWMTCSRGDGEVKVLSDDDTITALYVGIDHIDDTKGPLLNLVLAEDDILPVIDAVLEMADSQDGTAVSAAGYRVERTGDQVRIIRILPWW